MLEILKQVWNICWLKAGPQDLPYSISLFIIAILLSCIVSVFQLSFQQTYTQAFSQSLLMIAVTCAFSYGSLKWKKLSARFVQTTTALISTGTVISLLVFPLILTQYYILHPADQNLIAILLSLIFLFTIIILNIWIIVITAHIFRHALNISFINGLLVTLVYIAVNVLMYKILITA